MPTIDSVFRTGVQHTVYVTTDSQELGSILHKLGYDKDKSDGRGTHYFDMWGTYFLGSDRCHAMTARIDDLDLSEALLKQDEIGFHPQARIVLNCNGDQRSYTRHALELVEALARQDQWYAVCGFGIPFIHKRDLGRPKVLGKTY